MVLSRLMIDTPVHAVGVERDRAEIPGGAGSAGRCSGDRGRRAVRVSRQRVHTWLGRYRQERITGQFLGGWLARDPIRLGPLPGGFSSPTCSAPRSWARTWTASSFCSAPMAAVPVRPGRGRVRPGTAASPLRGPRTRQAAIHTAAINEWLCPDLLNCPGCSSHSCTHVTGAIIGLIRTTSTCR